MMDEGAHLRDQWATVERLRDVLVDQLIEEGYDVILDETFLPPGSIERVEVRFGHRANIEIIDLTHVPFEVCVDRDSKRERVVGRDNIAAYLNMMTEEERRRSLAIQKSTVS